MKRLLAIAIACVGEYTILKDLIFSNFVTNILGIIVLKVKIKKLYDKKNEIVVDHIMYFSTC